MTGRDADALSASYAEGVRARKRLAAKELRTCIEWLCMLICAHERRTQEENQGHSRREKLSGTPPREGTTSGIEIPKTSQKSARPIQGTSPEDTQSSNSEWTDNEANRLRRLRLGWTTSRASSGLQQTVRSSMVMLNLSREEAQDIIALAEALRRWPNEERPVEEKE